HVHAPARPRPGLRRPRAAGPLLLVRDRRRRRPRRLRPALRALPMRRLFGSALAVLALGGASASHAWTATRTGGDRILLVSDRDGVARAYRMRADGSGLAPRAARSRRLVPAAVSQDGRTG